MSNDNENTVNFRQKMNEILNSTKWDSQKELAEATGISTTTINRWCNDDKISLPKIDTLIKLARATNISLNWLLNVSDNHSMFNDINAQIVIDKNIYDSLKQDLLKNLQNELWLIFKTGDLVHNELEMKLLDESIRNNKIEKIKLLICNPNEKSSMDQIRTRRLFGLREEVASSIYRTLRNLLEMMENNNFINTNNEEAFQVFYSRYVPPVIAHVSDPESENGKILVIQANFRHLFEEAPALSFTKQDDENLYNYYIKDFSRMFEEHHTLPVLDKAKNKKPIPITERIKLSQIRDEIDRNNEQK